MIFAQILWLDIPNQDIPNFGMARNDYLYLSLI